MLGNFDKIFHPEKEWKDKKLTEMCPCSTCDTCQKYRDKALYGNIAERQYTELPESCYAFRISIGRWIAYLNLVGMRGMMRI